MKTTKRILAVLLAVACCLTMAATAFAASAEENTEITYFEDGSYLVKTITTEKSARAASTISGAVDAKYYNASDELRWVVTLSGTFSYTSGVSSSCTSASISATAYGGGWSCSTKNANASGNSAVGSATMIRKVLGIQVDSIPVSLTLSCDKYGNLS